MVIYLGHVTQPTKEQQSCGPFEFVDIRRREALENVVKKYNINVVYHLASLLSAVSEEKTDLAWDINVNGLKNILDLAKDYKMKGTDLSSSHMITI